MESGNRMKKIVFSLLFFLVIFLMIACPYVHFFYSTGSQVNNNDWSYKLYYNYEIWHINSDTIVLGKIKSPHSLSYVVDSYISAFCYNDTYVVVETLPNGKEGENHDYYIIKMDQDEVYGPYNTTTLNQEINNHDIGELCDWISTAERPKEASFS